VLDHVAAAPSLEERDARARIVAEEEMLGVERQRLMPDLGCIVAFTAARPGLRRMTAVVVGMTAVSLLIGLGVNFFYGVAERAARQVLDRPAYIEAVTGLPAPGGSGSAASRDRSRP
jgi:ABC-type proline/glycine betaine transport system permease subunit